MYIRPDVILDIAVWYVFPAALGIFAIGASYRILRYLFLYRKGLYVRRRVGVGSAIKGLIMTFLGPIIFNARTKPIDFIFSLLFLHIVGLIILVFLLGQHVAYIAAIMSQIAPIPLYPFVKPITVPLSSVTGALTTSAPTRPIEIPMIWGPLAAILNGDLLTLFVILGIGYKIGEKIFEKAHKAKNVRWGDLIIWPILLGIVITGWLAAHHTPPDIVSYRFVLGLHVLFAALFVMVWPFTKYFHFLWNYWYGKLHEWYDVVLKRGAH